MSKAWKIQERQHIRDSLRCQAPVYTSTTVDVPSSLLCSLPTAHLILVSYQGRHLNWNFFKFLSLLWWAEKFTHLTPPSCSELLGSTSHPQESHGPAIHPHGFLSIFCRDPLDSKLKSRDIILPTKVCLVNTMVFPVVVCGCESWTIKKAEQQRIDAFELWG